MHTFREYLANYKQEQEILTRLPNMDIEQQINTDIDLHNAAVSRGTFGATSADLNDDVQWKHKLLEIIRGQENNLEIIKQTIDIIKRDMRSHENRGSAPETGSQNWHQVWLRVYSQWLQRLQHILGVLWHEER